MHRAPDREDRVDTPRPHPTILRHPSHPLLLHYASTLPGMDLECHDPQSSEPTAQPLHLGMASSRTERRVVDPTGSACLCRRDEAERDGRFRGLFPPVDACHRIGIVAVAKVPTVARPGFLISRMKALGTGEEKSRPGERIILHVHGG